MDNDFGRGDRSHEPPSVATVRRLHLDAGDGTASGTEDWYETERLTGHITGGARASSQPSTAASAERPVALDWRHLEPPPARSLIERLGTRLHARRPHLHLHARNVRSTRGVRYPRAAAAKRTMRGAPELGTLAVTACADVSAGPALGLRGAAAAPRPATSWRARVVTAVGERERHRLSRWSWLLGGLALAVTVVMAAAIASHPRSAGKARATGAARTHPITGAAVAAVDAHLLGALRMVERSGMRETAGTMTRAAGSLGHAVRISAAHYHAMMVRERLRDQLRRRSRSSAGGRPSGSTSSPVVATTATSNVSSASSGSYSSSSSPPTYSSQSAPSTSSDNQPAGPSGLGGAVGGNCNPKCS